MQEDMANSLFNGLLPPEMKAEIFKHIDKKHRQKVRRVCTTWEKLISELYGVTIIFSNSKWVEDLPRFNGTVFAIFRNYNAKNSVPILTRPGGLDFVNRMSTLTLGGNLELSDLNPIFEECKNLQSLEFDNPSIPLPANNTTMKPEDLNKLLPSLKNLKIKSDKAKNSVRSYWFWVHLKNHRYIFASNLKSKLTSLHLHYTFWPNDQLYSDQIFDDDWTLPNNEFHSDFQLVVYELIKNSRETLLELQLDDTHYKRSTAFKFNPFSKSGVGESNSSVCEFSEKQESIVSQEDTFGLFHWLLFMGTQNHLEKFTLSGQLIGEWTKIVKIFTSNIATLKNVTLTNSQHQGNVQDQGLVGPSWNFNGLDFTRLHDLEELSLLSNNTGFKSNQYKGCWSELTNFQSLPTNLRILKLSMTIDFLHESNFCSNTFAGLKNLEVFEFSAYPWFTFGGVNKFYLDAKTVRSLAMWLTGLKQWTLRNRIIPDFKIPMTANTIPNLAIAWMKWVNGINFTKSIIGKIDETRFFTSQRTKDIIITISIDSAFRQNTIVL